MSTATEAASASTGIDLAERRERVFIVLAGFFLCAMTLLNVGLTNLYNWM